jgi:O-antigen ligase
VAPDFFRRGQFFSAYGDYIRANGVFSTVDSNGFFLITGMLLGSVFIKDIKIKSLFILLLSLGLFTTTLRTAWFTGALVLFVIFTRSNYKKAKNLIIASYLLFVILFIFIMIEPGFQSNNQWQELKTQRLLNSENILIRWELYKDNLKLIQEHPFGLGIVGSNYWNSMQKLNNLSLGPHNGFLGSAVRYGFIGAFLFLSWLASTCLFFLRNPKNLMDSSYLILLLMVVFILFNLFLDVSETKDMVFVSFVFQLGCLMPRM